MFWKGIEIPRPLKEARKRKEDVEQGQTVVEEVKYPTPATHGWQHVCTKVRWRERLITRNA